MNNLLRTVDRNSDETNHQKLNIILVKAQDVSKCLMVPVTIHVDATRATQVPPSPERNIKFGLRTDKLNQASFYNKLVKLSKN
jgi:hypothetical protein